MSGFSEGNRNYHPKRKFPRIATSNLLNYEYLDQDGKSLVQGVGVTLSLSEGGLLFETDRSISDGTPMEIQFTLSGNFIIAKGSVIYHLMKNEDQIKIGIRFTDIHEEHRDIIRKRAGEILPNFQDK